MEFNLQPANVFSRFVEYILCLMLKYNKIKNNKHAN